MMKNQIKRLIEIAYALKENHSTGRSFHVSGIFKKGKLLSLGINDYHKSHPQTLNFNYQPNAKIHSELRAALKLGLTDCSGLTMVNIRINNNGCLDNSKPCKGCAQLIQSLNFKNVFFSNQAGEIEKMEEQK